MKDDLAKLRCAGQPDCLAQTLNRRSFLSVTGASAGLMVVASAIPACGNQSISPPGGPVAAGNVSALSVGSLMMLSNVVVARDANGVYAMSRACTHQGCPVDDTSSGITGGLHCPCHGSAFDGNGAVTHGPAGSPLQHYAVTIAADGSMTVQGDQPVSSDTRTAAG
jgi:nitrite reductase/ring-hydroxylating ferredoxin subunit